MRSQPSLKTLLWSGLLVLNVVVIGGITATAHARARRDAKESMHDYLRIRAKTISGLLEIDKDGADLDLPPRVMPEYMTPGSGSYAVIYDSTGKAVARSPSLGGADLRLPAPWVEDAFTYDEVESGPDGIPCAVVAHSFVARVEGVKGAGADWKPPSDEQRRYQIVLAADSRPRDAGLAAFAGFLALAAGASIAATVLGGILLSRLVLSPLRRMTTEAAQLDPKDPSRRLRPETVVRELHSLSDTLNSALDRLGSALDRQRRFASDASHELRTPLAGIVGNAELLLRRERSGEEYRKGLERQIRIAGRMTRLTEDLLLLARGDDGHARIQPIPVDAAELTRLVCDEFDAAAKESEIGLSCETDGKVEILADPTYYEALVQNLVANALKFTPARGAVRVSVVRNCNDAILAVRDTGPGIASEHLPHVFERFYRVHHGRDRREGAGLGLAIVDWIARAHEGKVEVRSEVGRGTTFEVRLPLANRAPTA